MTYIVSSGALNSTPTNDASCLCAGLCLEKLPTVAVSRFRQAEREQLIIRCFELSGDISLLQLQERQVFRAHDGWG